MLEALLDQALQLEEADRAMFLQQVATHAEEYMDELRQILAQNISIHWNIAVQLFEMIRYPQNAPAIPDLVSHLIVGPLQRNFRAEEVVKRLPAEVVVPYMIAMLWDHHKQNPSYYLDDVSELCGVIARYGRVYALPCGPVIVSLISRYMYELELERMIWAIEVIGPEESLYAIPVLIEIAQTRSDPDMYTLAQQLLQRYPPEALAIYSGVLHAPEEPSETA